MIDLTPLQATLKSAGKLTLQIRVIPKCQRTAWSGTLGDGSLKLRVAAVPEKGKANAEIVRFLAGEFDVPKSAVEIVTGETSSNKLIRITAPLHPA